MLSTYKNVLRSRFIGFMSVMLVFIGMVYLALIEPQLPAPIRKPLNQPDFMFENVRLSLLDQGEVAWELDSLKSVVLNDELTDLYEVKGRFYKNEHPIVELKSPSGQLNMKKSDMVLKNAEVVFKGQGQPVTLNSDILNWKSQKSQLEGHGNVRIYTQGLLLKGNYFLVDMQKQVLIVSANSSARISR
jgi:LPS export ABC transporter protein LptC